MEEVLTCFGNIIGTTNDSESDSGLFITDLEAIATIQGLIDSDDQVDIDIEDKLANARRIAILRLNTDLVTLMARYAQVRDSMSIVVGSKSFSAPLVETGNSGIRIVCRKIKDAEIVLRRITTLFAQTGSTKVYIASNYSDTIVEIDVLTVANKQKTNELSESIVLPLWDMNAEGCVEYYIYHKNDLQALNTKIQCSTCTAFRFDASRPTWALYGHKQYVNIAGFNGEIETLSSSGQNSAKGLQLEMDIRCRVDKAICRDKIDFKANPMAMAMATAIQYQSASVIVWDLIRNPRLNRVLMGDLETFRDAAKYYGQKYNDMVKFISKNMEITSDCFCEHGFTKTKIGHP